MSMDIYLKDGTFTEPDAPCYFLIAGNGFYVRKENPVFSASVRLGALSWDNADFPRRLEDQEEFFELRIPKIPRKTVDEWIAFARIVRKIYKSEVLFLLFYSPETQEFENKVPEQRVGPASVRSTACIPTPEGRYLIGTVHSHPGGAFHSPDDKDDEVSSDCLHFTIGDLDSVLPTFAISGVVNGKRFPIPPEQIIETVNIPREWREKIHAD